ncbi:hypothetical protein [uncultured Pseudomonas sp.]|uniref:hypothetical protein n=1 Tax=uncultured Pseudomonas sp. TaxID=114707 RepID=UPI0030DB5B85|tara:strand:- start:5129 stop:5401 length:273 start_codon:yes stop_codon:yes gene_type:complete
MSLFIGQVLDRRSFDGEEFWTYMADQDIVTDTKPFPDKCSPIRVSETLLFSLRSASYNDASTLVFVSRGVISWRLLPSLLPDFSSVIPVL